MKRFLTITLLIAVFASFAPNTHAQRKSQVLGTATPSSEVVFPPISTAGPGNFLPDSPLFFLDKTYQFLRLATTHNPLKKSRMHTQIAGERLAELRIMFERNNEDAITETLHLLSKELNRAATKLSEAQAEGQSVEQDAITLNQLIKDYRDLLRQLEEQTDHTLTLKLKTARQSLLEAKLEVEDNLPSHELEKEIAQDLSSEIIAEVDDTQESLQRLKDYLATLKEHREQARIRNQTNREEVLQEAIDEIENSLRERGIDPDEESEENSLDEAIESTETAEEEVSRIKEIVEEGKEAAQTYPTTEQDR